MRFNPHAIRISFFSLVMVLFLLSGIHSSFAQNNEESFEELSAEDLELIAEYLDQAKTFFEQRFTESAIFHYDKVLAINPLNIDALNGKGIVLDYVGDHEEAISYFDEVLLIDSNNVDALLGKAFALDNLGKPEEAQSYFDMVLEIQQAFQDISDEDLDLLEENLEKAEELFEEENYEEAILFYDKVLTIDSTDIDALFGMALALENLERYEDAISYYHQILAIDSTDRDALFGIALALETLEKYEEAITYYDAVLAIDSTDEDALFGKAISLEGLGKEEEAIPLLEKVVELEPPEVESSVPPEETLNQDDIVEFDQTLFVIVGVFIVILISIILIDFIARRKKTVTNFETPASEQYSFLSKSSSTSNQKIDDINPEQKDVTSNLEVNQAIKVLKNLANMKMLDDSKTVKQFLLSKGFSENAVKDAMQSMGIDSS